MRLATASCTVLLLAVTPCLPAAEPLTPKGLEAALARKPAGAQADQLADQVRMMFGGKEALAKGPAAKVEGRTVAWAVATPRSDVTPRVVSTLGNLDLPLQRIGETDVFAAAREFPHGTALRYLYVIGDAKLTDARSPNGRQLELYDVHPDSKPGPDVPRGELKQMPKFESKIFDGTTRDWWVYVPAQYKPEKPACVMVFQDGGNYKDFVPPVFDQLIHKKEMPVTVGVFINPGVFKGTNRSNRSFEYDTLSDQYARFLLEEILPEVEKTVKLRHDPESRAIAGISSGGICAFTVAWERPDQFSKVLSWVGSFTNIASGKTGREGGHNYQAIIRKTPMKPIRVYLQAGANDLDNEHGHWPLANLTLAKSLAFKGYDYHLEYGQGFHSNAHGKAILPDSLRWLWLDYKAE